MYDEKKSAPKTLLAVAAGKGGVGKSTVAVSLARLLKSRGIRVGLLDADLYGPSLKKMLKEERLPMRRGDQIVPAYAEGIRFLSLAHFRNEDSAAVVRAPIANGVITQFLQQADWSDVDFLILDLPPGTGDIQLTLCQKAPITAALLVTTPQEVALLDVKKAMDAFRQLRVPIAGVVENMSYYLPPGSQEKHHPFGQGGGRKLAAECGEPFLGEIPLEPLLSQSLDRSESLFESEEGEDCRRAFEEVLDQTLSQLSLIQEGKGQNLESFELIWK